MTKGCIGAEQMGLDLSRWILPPLSFRPPRLEERIIRNTAKLAMLLMV